MNIIPIKTNSQIIKERLAAEGFKGLYVPGTCGCRIDDLAPCGSATMDEDGWINGCEPGYVQSDPSGKTSEWIIKGSAEPMDQATFNQTLQSC